MAWNDEPQPTLTTARIVLRPYVAADGPRVEELAGAREVADTTAVIPHPYPVGGGAEWIAGHLARWTAGESITFAVTTPEDGVVGTIGLGISRRVNAGTMGYFIGVPYWGRGYATEAAGAVIDFAFRAVGLNRIDATYLTRNPASARVMEKLGMQPEGVFRQAERKWDIYEDVAQMAILRSDWDARRR